MFYPGVRGGQDQGEEQGFDQEDPVKQHGKEVAFFYLVLSFKQIFLSCIEYWPIM